MSSQKILVVVFIWKVILPEGRSVELQIANPNEIVLGNKKGLCEKRINIYIYINFNIFIIWSIYNSHILVFSYVNLGVFGGWGHVQTRCICAHCMPTSEAECMPTSEAETSEKNHLAELQSFPMDWCDCTFMLLDLKTNYCFQRPETNVWNEHKNIRTHPKLLVGKLQTR